MKFLSNAHTHTPYCDGKSTIEETLRAARTLGFVSLGFSGHGDQGFDPLYSMTDGRQARYVSELRALQAAFLQRGDAPRLWVGVEEDIVTPPELKALNREQLDYIIGSTHYLELDFHGATVGVDGDPDALLRYVRERMDGDGLQMAKRYFDLHVSGLMENRPDIIGHFDLVRKYARRLSLFDEAGAAYRRLALDALERAFPCGAKLELNTGGMARGYMKEPFPSRELLGAWRELGGEVTITSDCHDAALLDFGFAEAMRLLAQTGYTRVWRLGRGSELWEDERVAVARA